MRGAIVSKVHKPAFLEDADRGEVVLRYAGVKRADRFQPKESGERFSSHAAAPKGAVDPIADFLRLRLIRSLPLSPSAIVYPGRSHGIVSPAARVGTPAQDQARLKCS